MDTIQNATQYGPILLVQTMELLEVFEYFELWTLSCDYGISQTEDKLLRKPATPSGGPFPIEIHHQLPMISNS